MRVTALVQSLDHVCCRYRLAAFHDAWSQAGFDLHLHAIPTCAGQWLALGRKLRGSSAVILQRRLLPAWQLFLLRRYATKLFFDFDDAVFLRDSFASKGLQSRRRLRRFAATLRACDGVAAGNEYLRLSSCRWTNPDRIEIIPTCVDPSKYSTAVHQRTNANVELVWIGSSSTLQGLGAVRPLLEEIGTRIPELKLKLICDRFLRFEKLPVVECPWTEAGESAALSAADIGISWVPDDDWSRGKCGLKVLQYMAAGLPVVANPVGIHLEVIEHGKNGYLAQTPAQWIDAIGRLARDPNLRQQLGQAGRLRLEREYSVAAGAERWIALLRRTLGELREVA